jgi:hypothetical protein
MAALSSAISVAFSASWARAQELPGAPAAAPAPAAVQPASSPVHRVSRWYGSQTLATDGISLVLSFAAIAANDSQASSALGIASLGTFVLGGPLVHFAHGQVGKGFGSLALRTALPLAAGFAGGQLASADCGAEFCGIGGVLLGGLTGVVAAVAIDSAGLAYEPVRERTSSWPILGVTSDGKRTLVTAVGRF